jgi:hypothetical protein
VVGRRLLADHHVGLRHGHEPLPGPPHQRLRQIDPAAVTGDRHGEQAQPPAAAGVEPVHGNVATGRHPVEVEPGDHAGGGEPEAVVRVAVERRPPSVR